MDRFLYSLCLSLVLLVPEPATFALVVFTAICFVVSGVRSFPSLFLPIDAEPVPVVVHAPAEA